MCVRLIESLATTRPLAELFSDRSALEAMLAFETALARAEARLGVIPQAASAAIERAAKLDSFDASALAGDALSVGTLAIPFVRALTEMVRAADPVAAGFVHWGATSQDVTDTALVLLLRRAQGILGADLGRLEAALYRLSEQHAGTVLLGRSFLQAAPPVTFGLKAAGWLGAIHRSRARLEACFAETLVVQFGGATGTLAALDDLGLAIGQALSSELGLGYPDAPWHTHRDRLAALVSALGVLAGSLGKMARDIALLAQSEVAEVAEPSGPGRGGSSTMPQKRNPVGCALALAAGERVPSLVSAFLTSMVQEHERALGLQAEWPLMAAAIQGTGLATVCMADVAEGLTVYPERMRANIAATQGAIFAERAMIKLGEKLGRDTAHKLLEEAVRQATATGRDLAETLAGIPEAAQHLDAATLRTLQSPESYLGVAEQFRRRILASSGVDVKRKRQEG